MKTNRLTWKLLTAFSLIFVTDSLLPGQGRNREEAAGRARPGGTVQIGVRVANRDFGVEVTQVFPGSPASQMGLEVGDFIITVGGYQVGYVYGRLYDLSEECSRRVDGNGNVRLVIRQQRTGFLANLDVPVGMPLPPLPPGPLPPQPPQPGYDQNTIVGVVKTSVPFPIPPGSILNIRLIQEGPSGGAAAVVTEATLPQVPGFPINYQLPFRPSQLTPNRRYFTDARLINGPNILAQTAAPVWFQGGNRPRMDMVLVPQTAPPPDQSPVGIITQWYRIYLGREPDPTGLNAQIAALQAGTPLGEIQISLLASSEFYDRCQNNPQIFVTQLYTLALNRQPSSRDVNYWVDRLRGVHKGNRTAMVREFMTVAARG